MKKWEQLENWLDSASAEELEAELSALQEEGPQGAGYSEQIAWGLSEYEEVIFNVASARCGRMS